MKWCLTILAILAIPLAACGDGDTVADELTCDDSHRDAEDEIRAFAAEHAACESAADCEIVGIFRDTCNCDLDFTVSINHSGAAKAEQLIDKAASCGFISKTCDDYYAEIATCEGGACSYDIDVKSCFPGPCDRPQQEAVDEIYAFELAHNLCDDDDDCVPVGIFEGDCDGTGRELAVAVNPDAVAQARALIEDAQMCLFVPNNPADDFFFDDAFCDGNHHCRLTNYGQCNLPAPDAGADAGPDASVMDASTVDASVDARTRGDGL